MRNLKLQVTATPEWDMKVSIVEAGRGAWTLLGELGRVFVFEGFETENRLTVMFELLQDGTIDITLVGNQVDCCAKVYNERLPRPSRRDCFNPESDAKRITEWLNARIMDLDL